MSDAVICISDSDDDTDDLVITSAHIRKRKRSGPKHNTGNPPIPHTVEHNAANPPAPQSYSTVIPRTVERMLSHPSSGDDTQCQQNQLAAAAAIRRLEPRQSSYAALPANIEAVTVPHSVDPQLPSEQQFHCNGPGSGHVTENSGFSNVNSSYVNNSALGNENNSDVSNLNNSALRNVNTSNVNNSGFRNANNSNIHSSVDKGKPHMLVPVVPSQNKIPRMANSEVQKRRQKVVPQNNTDKVVYLPKGVIPLFQPNSANVLNLLLPIVMNNACQSDSSQSQQSSQYRNNVQCIIEPENSSQNNNIIVNSTNRSPVRSNNNKGVNLFRVNADNSSQNNSIVVHNVNKSPISSNKVNVNTSQIGSIGVNDTNMSQNSSIIVNNANRSKLSANKVNSNNPLTNSINTTNSAKNQSAMINYAHFVDGSISRVMSGEEVHSTILRSLLLDHSESQAGKSVGGKEDVIVINDGEEDSESVNVKSNSIQDSGRILNHTRACSVQSATGENQTTGKMKETESSDQNKPIQSESTTSKSHDQMTVCESHLELSDQNKPIQSESTMAMDTSHDQTTVCESHFKLSDQNKPIQSESTMALNTSQDQTTVGESHFEPQSLLDFNILNIPHAYEDTIVKDEDQTQDELKYVPPQAIVSSDIMGRISDTSNRAEQFSQEPSAGIQSQISQEHLPSEGIKCETVENSVETGSCKEMDNQVKCKLKYNTCHVDYFFKKKDCYIDQVKSKRGEDSLKGTYEQNNVTHELDNVTAKQENDTPGQSNVTHEQDNVTHEQDNVTHEQENVTHEQNNVTHGQSYVTHGIDNVTHEQDNVTHEQDNVTTRQSNVNHEQGNVTTRQSNVNHEQGNVTHEQGNVTHEQDNVTHIHGNVTHVQCNVTHAQRNVTREQDVTHKQGNVTHDQGNVTHEHGNVTHGQCNDTPGQSNVTHEQGNVTHEQGNVTHEKGYVTHEQDNVTHEQDNVTAKDDHVTHGQSNVTDGQCTVTDEQSNVVTDKQSNVVTDKQSNVVTDKQCIVITDEQCNVTDKQSNVVTDKQCHVVTDKQCNVITDKQCNVVTDEQCIVITDKQCNVTDEQCIVTDEQCIVVTDEQCIVTDEPCNVTDEQTNVTHGTHGLDKVTAKQGNVTDKQCNVHDALSRREICEISTERPSYRCPECDQEFQQELSLNFHMLKHDAAREFVFSCRDCGKNCLSAGALQQHRAQFHLPPTEPTKRYKCGYCRKKFRSHASRSKHWKESHPSIFSHRCSDCGLCFRKKTYLTTHRYKQKCTHKKQGAPSHTEGKGSSRVECELCGRCFQMRLSVTLHQKSGCKVGILCPLCPLYFITQLTLSSHVNSNHQSEEKNRLVDRHGYLRCEFCNKVFPEKIRLRWHVKTTHTLKPLGAKGKKTGQNNVTYNTDLICVQCEGTFSNAAEYKRHRRVCYVKNTAPTESMSELHKNSAKDLTCNNCDKKFNNIPALVQHRATCATNSNASSGSESENGASDSEMDASNDDCNMESLTCTRCNESVENNADFVRHINMCNNIPTPHQNNTELKINNELNSEFNSDTEIENDYEVTCKKCSEKFLNVDDLKKHRMNCVANSSENGGTDSQMYISYNVCNKESLTCTGCNESVKNNADFVKHIKMCNKTLTSNQNNAESKNNNELNSELNGGIDSEMDVSNSDCNMVSLKCTRCKEYVQNNADFVKHIKMCYKTPTPHQNNTELKNSNELNLETKIVGSDNKFKCAVCKYVVMSNKLLVRHVLAYHNSESKTTLEKHGYFTCSFCGNVYCGERALGMHSRAKHPLKGFGSRARKVDISENSCVYNSETEKADSENEKVFRCTSCMERFSSTLELEEHQIFYKHAIRYGFHDDDYEFKCAICESKFPSSELLAQHLYTRHKSESRKPDESHGYFVCKFCEKMYVLERNLGKHLHSVHSFRGFGLGGETVKTFNIVDKCLSGKGLNMSEKHTTVNGLNNVNSTATRGLSNTNKYAGVECLNTNDKRQEVKGITISDACNAIEWYECEQCFEKLPSAADLGKHILACAVNNHLKTDKNIPNDSVNLNTDHTVETVSKDGLDNCSDAVVFVCKTCADTFTSYTDLQKHRLNCLKTSLNSPGGKKTKRTSNLECQYCSKICLDLRELEIHRLSCSVELSDGEKRGNNLMATCNRCSERFSYPVVFEKHQSACFEKNSGSRYIDVDSTSIYVDLSCKECLKVCSNYIDFKKHKLTCMKKIESPEARTYLNDIDVDRASIGVDLACKRLSKVCENYVDYNKHKLNCEVEGNCDKASTDWNVSEVEDNCDKASRDWNVNEVEGNCDKTNTDLNVSEVEGNCHKASTDLNVSEVQGNCDKASTDWNVSEVEGNCDKASTDWNVSEVEGNCDKASTDWNVSEVEGNCDKTSNDWNVYEVEDDCEEDKNYKCEKCLESFYSDWSLQWHVCTTENLHSSRSKSLERENPDSSRRKSLEWENPNSSKRQLLQSENNLKDAKSVDGYLKNSNDIDLISYLSNEDKNQNLSTGNVESIIIESDSDSDSDIHDLIDKNNSYDRILVPECNKSRENDHVNEHSIAKNVNAELSSENDEPEVIIEFENTEEYSQTLKNNHGNSEEKRVAVVQKDEHTHDEVTKGPPQKSQYISADDISGGPSQKCENVTEEISRGPFQDDKNNFRRAFQNDEDFVKYIRERFYSSEQTSYIYRPSTDTRYKCVRCFKLFFKETFLQEHLQRCTETHQSYMDYIANLSENDIIELKIKKFQGNVIVNQSEELDLQSNQSLQKKISPIEYETLKRSCEECPAAVHLRLKHRYMRCGFCASVYKSCQDAFRHMKSRHATRFHPPFYLCVQCGLVFKQAARLRAHEAEGRCKSGSNSGGSNSGGSNSGGSNSGGSNSGGSNSGGSNSGGSNSGGSNSDGSNSGGSNRSNSGGSNSGGSNSGNLNGGSNSQNLICSSDSRNITHGSNSDYINCGSNSDDINCGSYMKGLCELEVQEGVINTRFINIYA